MSRIANSLILDEACPFDTALVRPERWRKLWVAAATLLALATISYLDYRSGGTKSASLFYLAPVVAAVWWLGTVAGFWMSALAAGLWLMVDRWSGAAEAASLEGQLIHAGLRLAFFWAASLALGCVRKAFDEMNAKLDDRTSLLQMELAEHTRAATAMKESSDRELRRIAYDLHDGVCQTLTGISFKAKVVQENLAAASLPYVRETQEIVGHLNTCVGQIRNLVRGLAPPEVEFDELLTALRRMAVETEQVFQVSGLVNSDRATVPIETPRCLHLYRIAQEATNNAIKHGHARGVEIDVTTEDEQLKVRIRDNGIGFTQGPSVQVGLGLRTMKYRAKLLGGTLHVRSSPGAGTEVECVVPSNFLQADGEL